ncbi:putative F-box domain, galactose oxidase/kelch, beta-propeller, F-box-like domain superfamily [Dioscorea sansibarensis]
MIRRHQPVQMELNKKRKAAEEAEMISVISFDELNEDLLEKVLAWLPAASFCRLRLVCKRWNSVATSATFKIACSQIPYRDPWFLMVGQELNQSIVFDTSEWKWRSISHQNLLCRNTVPVASSGGLICFQTISGDFVVGNPVTGACRELPPATPTRDTQTLHAVAMNSSPKAQSSYRIILVYSESSKLTLKVYDASAGLWENDMMLHRKAESSTMSGMAGNETVYFLSKAGDVVAASVQRCSSKQYSSVLIIENGEEVVYFLSHTGSVIACNVTQKYFFEYPRMLPVYSEYSIDVVDCKGEMLVVVLSDFLESASLRVWRFCKGDSAWRQIAAMPPWMSHEFYGKKADINCVGCGDNIFICINSSKFSSYVMCDVVINEWIELPKCYVNREPIEFVSAFSFEPRMEVSV